MASSRPIILQGTWLSVDKKILVHLLKNEMPESSGFGLRFLNKIDKSTCEPNTKSLQTFYKNFEGVYVLDMEKNRFKNLVTPLCESLFPLRRISFYSQVKKFTIFADEQF